MDLKNIENRRIAGKNLKINFDFMINEITQSVGVEKFSYMDMKLISDAMKLDIPKKVGLKELPIQVVQALALATASMDPNEIRREDDVKKVLSLGAGAGGVTVATISLGSILNPGLWATTVAYLTGGIAAPPLAVLGLIGGVGTFVASLYKCMSEKNPNERVVNCISMVNKSIDDWIQNG